MPKYLLQLSLEIDISDEAALRNAAYHEAKRFDEGTDREIPN